MRFFVDLALVVLRNFTAIPAVKTFVFQSLDEIFFLYSFTDTCSFLLLNTSIALMGPYILTEEKSESNFLLQNFTKAMVVDLSKPHVYI